MAAMTCMYSSATPASSTCRRETSTEEEVEELAYQEEGRCKSRLASRRRRHGQPGEGGAAAPGEAVEEEMWEGMVMRELDGVGVEEAWEMVGRFGQLKRWNPNAEVCEVEEGEEDKPGCVRFLAGSVKAADGSPERWVREKLLAMYPKQRCFTYCILDSSYGFQGYTARLSILPGAQKARAALAHWTFELHPVACTPAPQLLSFLTSIFDNMMASLERTIINNDTSCS
ncbi:hypothetical protein L7F22_040919 [Adiantum nelumboides]|nr:hypothetical protein [Adiantum nelumboides]